MFRLLFCSPLIFLFEMKTTGTAGILQLQETVTLVIMFLQVVLLPESLLVFFVFSGSTIPSASNRSGDILRYLEIKIH